MQSGEACLKFFKKLNYTILLIGFFISNQMFVQAQNHRGQGEPSQQPNCSSHKHDQKVLQSPHGGELITVGKYIFEVILNVMEGEEKLIVYLLSSKAKVLELKDATGRITLKYKDGREIETEFKYRDKGKLYCNVEDIINEFVVVIEIIYKGKVYSTVCEYTGLSDHLKKLKEK